MNQMEEHQQHEQEQPEQQRPPALSPLKRPPKKPRDERLRSCFDISVLPDGISIICRYCNDYTKHVQKFNPTNCRSHLVMQCTGVDDELRRTLMENSQEFKRLKRLEEAVENNQMTLNAAATTTNNNDNSAPTDTTTTQIQPQPKPKQKRIEMKEYTQLYAHQEKRQQERHYFDMWKDISREISRLRKERMETEDVEVMEEVEGDIGRLVRKKADYARLLGMK